MSLMPDIRNVSVEVTFDPPWKPEMMTQEAREKLGFDEEINETEQETLETTWE